MHETLNYTENCSRGNMQQLKNKFASEFLDAHRLILTSHPMNANILNGANETVQRVGNRAHLS
jgi:hypothetical protein